MRSSFQFVFSLCVVWIGFLFVLNVGWRDEAQFSKVGPPYQAFIWAGSEFEQAHASLASTSELKSSLYEESKSQSENFLLEPPDLKGRVSSLMQEPVPWFDESDKVTYGMMFSRFSNKCPLWIVGGTVRDLLAGQEPNDVDVVALCTAKILCDELKLEPFQPSYCNEKGKWFNMGHMDKVEPGKFFEGMTLGLLFDDPFTAEYSASSLMWSVSHSILIDPTHNGVNDARNKMLRPASPSKMPNSHTVSHQWTLWTAWIKGDLKAESFDRLCRYLKMLVRGWKPFDDNFGAFMVVQIVIQACRAHLSKHAMPDWFFKYLFDVHKVGGRGGVQTLLTVLTTQLQNYYKTAEGFAAKEMNKNGYFGRLAPHFEEARELIKFASLQNPESIIKIIWSEPHAAAALTNTRKYKAFVSDTVFD